MKGLNELRRLYAENKRKTHPNLPEFAISVPKFGDKTANQLTKAIITFINLNSGQAERISNTGRYIDQTKIVTDCLGVRKKIGSGKYIPGTGTNGTADISATIASRSVKIEVKIGKDKMSEAQIKYKESVEAAGGIYYIAKDFQSFFEWHVKTFREDAI